MTEALANRDAENLLKVPDNLIRSCGEAVTPEFRLDFLVDRLQREPTMIDDCLRAPLGPCGVCVEWDSRDGG